MEVESLTKLNMFKDFKVNSTISCLLPGKKNLNLIFIVLERKKIIKIKSDQQIYVYLVADKSGSILANFFDEIGELIKEGDILYVSSAYCSLHKGQLLLYSPKLNHGTILKIDEYSLAFTETPFLSEDYWEKVGEEFKKV